MRPVKDPTEELSRDEAGNVLEWLVDVLHKPTPKRGKFHLLHRTPKDVAEEFNVSVEDVLKASRRKLPQPA